MHRRGPVHPVPQPGEHLEVVVVDAELAPRPAGAVGVRAVRRVRGAALPGVLRARVEGRAGEVEPDRAAPVVEPLRLEPGQDPQRLGVALEPAARVADLVERTLPVVPERRVAEVVGERGRLHDVRVAAQGAAEVAGHLGHLEGVRQPVADEVVGLRTHHLGLRGQPPQRRGVHQPAAVALERCPAVRGGAFGRLSHPAGASVLVVLRHRPHRVRPYCRPATVSGHGVTNR